MIGPRCNFPVLDADKGARLCGAPATTKRNLDGVTFSACARCAAASDGNAVSTALVLASSGKRPAGVGRRYVNPTIVQTQDLREGDVLFAAPGYSDRAWRAERTEEWIRDGYKRVSCHASPEEQARIKAHITSVCNREDIIRTALSIGLNMLDKWYPVRPVGKAAKGGAK